MFPTTSFRSQNRALRARPVVAVTLFACLVLPMGAVADVLYFSSGSGIEAVDLDGNNRRPLTTFGSLTDRLVDMTVDPVSRDLIWAMYESGSGETVFYRAAPKAKTPDEMFRVPQGSDFRSIAVDGVAGKLYWARGGQTDAIQRANMDGTGVETLVESVGIGLFAIVVFPEHDEMYWTSTTVYGSQGTIHRATLDGNEPDSLVTGQGWPSGISVDHENGKIYWADKFWNAVRGANLADGSNVQTVIPGIGEPVGIALDVTAGRVYWVDTIANRLQSADVVQKDVTDLFAVDSPERVCILPPAPVAVERRSMSGVRSLYR